MASFTMNGKPVSVDADPNTPLLWVIRDVIGLTGTKYGCGEGQCGACTVLVNGKAQRSCIPKVASVAQKEVTTIEGLASGEELHPVQQAFLTEGAFQCGYCTPGMILGMVGLLNEKPNATEQDILLRLQKHLCRCCSYTTILKAIRRAVK